MIEADSETAINDYIAQFLLRYFRNATQIKVAQPNLDPKQDIDLLRMYWSISKPVCDLVSYLSEHRHEIQTVMEFRKHEDDARVRGRFDSRATVIRTLMTGHPTLTVSSEPVRTIDTGPNHVLTWVLETAWRLAEHFGNLLPQGAAHRESIERSTLELEKIRRFDAIRQAIKKINLGRRPASQSVRRANNSRRRLYVLACHAFRALQLIESGEADAIRRLLNDTLLGPLYVWQRYELAVGLAISRALSIELMQPVSLSFLEGGREPISRIGGYEVHWQSRTKAYEVPFAEPSEEMTEKLLKQYGLSYGVERPDLVVLDPNGKAISIVEVKYFEIGRSDGADAIRTALGQLVRYSRGYRPMTEIEHFLDLSILAVIRRTAGHMPTPKPYGLPLLVDFSGIVHRDLESWAHHVVSAQK